MPHPKTGKKENRDNQAGDFLITLKQDLKGVISLFSFFSIGNIYSYMWGLERVGGPGHLLLFSSARNWCRPASQIKLFLSAQFSDTIGERREGRLWPIISRAEIKWEYVMLVIKLEASHLPTICFISLSYVFQFRSTLERASKWCSRGSMPPLLTKLTSWQFNTWNWCYVATQVLKSQKLPRSHLTMLGSQGFQPGW